MGDGRVVGEGVLGRAQLGLAGADLLLVGGQVAPVDRPDGEAGVADGGPAGGQRDLPGLVRGAEVGADRADDGLEPGVPGGFCAQGAQLAWRRRRACWVTDGRGCVGR